MLLDTLREPAVVEGGAVPTKLLITATLAENEIEGAMPETERFPVPMLLDTVKEVAVVEGSTVPTELLIAFKLAENDIEGVMPEPEEVGTNPVVEGCPPDSVLIGIDNVGADADADPRLSVLVTFELLPVKLEPVPVGLATGNKTLVEIPRGEITALDSVDEEFADGELTGTEIFAEFDTDCTFETEIVAVKVELLREAEFCVDDIAGLDRDDVFKIGVKAKLVLWDDRPGLDDEAGDPSPVEFWMLDCTDGLIDGAPPVVDNVKDKDPTAVEFLLVDCAVGWKD